MKTYLVITNQRFGKGPRQTVTRKMVVLANSQAEAEAQGLAASDEGAKVIRVEELQAGIVTTIAVV